MRLSPMPSLSYTTATGSGAPAIQHPTYARYKATWLKLFDVYHGTGGFLDGTYLVPHPREWKDWKAAAPKTPTSKLLKRRELAHYANVAATILDQKASALFRGAVTRTVNGKEGDSPLEQWWRNVDGSDEGCPIDDWMRDGFIAAGNLGHVFHYMDRKPSPESATAADANAPYLRYYLPLDVPDWLQNDQGQLTAVKLLEIVPRTSLKEQPVQNQFRERYVTDTEWEVYEGGALQAVDRGEHRMGVVPIVVQYARRRRLEPLIGKSIFENPQLYISLYNLDSEVRELLRSQTFGILNVPYGTGDQATDVRKVKAVMGDEKGVENILLTPALASYLQPDSSNVTVYQAERQELLRTIYRLCAIPWESDSKDAEAEGSMKLKREDMNQVLAAYADECEKTEYAIAKLWYRATYGEVWERRWDADQVVVNYPDTFDVTPFAEILEQAQAAISLEMGPTFMKELRRRLVPKFLPDAPPDVVEAIEKELEETPVKSPAQQKLDEMAVRFGGQPGAQPGGKQVAH